MTLIRRREFFVYLALVKTVMVTKGGEMFLGCHANNTINIIHNN